MPTPEFQRLVDATKLILVHNDDQPPVARAELIVHAVLEQMKRMVPTYSQDAGLWLWKLLGQRAEAEKSEKTEKFCLNCKYSHDCGDIGHKVWGCDVEALIDPVDGKKLYRRCTEMRKLGGACGTDGKLWEKADIG